MRPGTAASLSFLAISTLGGAIANNVQPIIIDTDLMSDVDDVGALAVANVLHNCGLADLKGIAINTNSQYGALAANVRRMS